MKDWGKIEKTGETWKINAIFYNIPTKYPRLDPGAEGRH